MTFSPLEISFFKVNVCESPWGMVIRLVCAWWHRHRLPTGSHHCSGAVLEGTQLPRPPQQVLPPPTPSLLRCRGVMPPTDTPSPRQQRQRTATGKHPRAAGIAPGWGESSVSPPDHPLRHSPAFVRQAQGGCPANWGSCAPPGLVLLVGRSGKVPRGTEGGSSRAGDAAEGRQDPGPCH